MVIKGIEMSLLNKLRFKYTAPQIEVINFNNQDIITTSSEIPIARLSPEETVEESKKKREKEPPYLTDNSRVVLGTGNIVDVYPKGLPRNVLEIIDYSKFGAMLKRERLLAPSYDRRPINVEIDNRYGSPRVILTFKSTKSENVRFVSIMGFSVSYSKKINTELTILEVNLEMMEVWCEFAERVMWAWENGYRYSLLDHKRKGEPTFTVHDEASLSILQRNKNNEQD